MAPLLVAGLGNPGSVYRRTRHNVGFLVVEELAARAQTGFLAGKGEYYWADLRIGAEEIILLLPTTFMNASGEAVIDAMERFQIPPDRLLVVADDLALPLGALRMRTAGSDGGHNGLASVIYHLATDAFPRLRCGIRRDDMPPKEDTAAFVLTPFAREEETVVGEMIARAADAVMTVVESGMDRAMTLFNRTP